MEWFEFLKKKFPSNSRVRRSTNEKDSELMIIIEMLRDILIFSAGFVFGLLVVLAISNFKVDINHVVTHTPTLGTIHILRKSLVGGRGVRKC